MSAVGEREIETQRRVVRFFRDALGYGYLGDWTDRCGNSNIEQGILASWLRLQGHGDRITNRAIELLRKVASVGGATNLYDANREVYGLLRYGVKVQPRGCATASSKRLALYKMAAAYLRTYADLANEMEAAGYSTAEARTIRDEVDHYEKVRSEVKLASGDYIDLKVYEPAMRHLLDTHIRAGESEKISAFDDLPLVELILERGTGALDSLPDGIRGNREAMAETIENNVRRLIIDEMADFRGHPMKEKKIRNAIKNVLPDNDLVDQLFEIVKAQRELRATSCKLPTLRSKSSARTSRTCTLGYIPRRGAFEWPRQFGSTKKRFGSRWFQSCHGFTSGKPVSPPSPGSPNANSSQARAITSKAAATG